MAPWLCLPPFVRWRVVLLDFNSLGHSDLGSILIFAVQAVFEFTKLFMVEDSLAVSHLSLQADHH